MIATLISITISFYAIIILIFTLGLFSSREKRSTLEPFISVVIPALNEKNHIEQILYDVTHQTYPSDRYEILVVDDESTDITPNLVRAFMDRYQNLRMLSSREGDHNLKYKKRPLDVGVRAAQGEIILQTDADCRVSNRWIETMTSYFTTHVGMVIGNSTIEPDESILGQVEALDFLMLSAMSRSTSQCGTPFAGTGQNLAFRKKAFLDVGGFSAFADALGGDDNFLLQAIHKESKWDVTMAIDKNSFVQTIPSKTFNAFISQRIRWASDSLYFRQANPLFFLVIITTFLANLLLLFSALTNLIGVGSVTHLINNLMIKFLAEGFMMVKATNIFNNQNLRRSFVLWFFFQIPYVVYMGFMTLISKDTTWGGRHQA